MNHFFEEQVTRELDMHTRGVNKFRASIKEAQAASAEDRLFYGQKAMSKAILDFTARIKLWIDERKGKRGVQPLLVKLDVKPDVLAYITLEHIVAGMTRPDGRDLVTLSDKIGKAIETEQRWTLIYKKDKDHKHHRSIIRKAMEIAESPGSLPGVVRAAKFLRSRDEAINGDVPAWSKEDRVILGTLLVSILCQDGTLGFMLEYKGRRGDDARYTVMLTEERSASIQESITANELRAAELEPMVCPPQPWSAADVGGYITTHVGRHTMVRGPMEEGDFEKMPVVVAALNKAQNTAWKINPDILKVMNWAYPSDELKDRTGLLSVDTTGARTVLANFHRIANEMATFPAFWIPHNLCWRGRVMAMPMFSFQGPDVCRGLMYMHNEAHIGEDGLKWLSLHIANNYGHGFEKATFNDRQDFAFKYEAKIIKFAKLIRKALDGRVSPERASKILNLTKHIWCDGTEAPFQFLAACLEWYAIREEGKRTSGLTIGFDGANNAIQHGSSFLRDAEGAAWVNVCEASPDSKPADLYSAVAVAVNKKLDALAVDNDTSAFSKSCAITHQEFAQQWKKYGVTRKTCKRIVMTRGYAGSMYGASDMIMDDIVSKDPNQPFGVNARAATVFMGQIIHHASMEVLSGLARSMKFLQSVAEAAKGERFIYVHPTTGYIFRQAYYKKKVKRVYMRSLPHLTKGQNMKVNIASDTREIDSRKMAAGISANFTHSNDAAHLMMTTLACDYELGLVHDSFSAAPGNCTDLFRTVREKFIEMHSANLLKHVHETYAHLNVELPAQGTLDLNVVLKAPYAFV